MVWGLFTSSDRLSCRVKIGSNPICAVAVALRRTTRSDKKTCSCKQTFIASPWGRFITQIDGRIQFCEAQFRPKFNPIEILVEKITLTRRRPSRWAFQSWEWCPRSSGWPPWSRESSSRGSGPSGRWSRCPWRTTRQWLPGVNVRICIFGDFLTIFGDFFNNFRRFLNNFRRFFQQFSAIFSTIFGDFFNNFRRFFQQFSAIF
jgi:hypothetical protein